MNIGFLIPSLEGGGAERTVVTVANQLSKNGHNIYIYIFYGDLMAYELDKNIHKRICSKKKSNMRTVRILSRAKNLACHIREDRIELLFAFMISMVPYALAACHGTNCKVIGSERTNPKLHNKVFQWVIRYLSPLCDGFIFQTKGAKAYYPQKTQTNGIVIPNSAPLYKKLWDKPDDIRICSVGRLHQDKDFNTLIQAFSIFNRKYENSTLTIFGEGYMKDELIALTKHLKIADKVIFSGFVHNILDEISQYSMFVFSSAAEGMPNALLEAMSVGLPCISTDCPYGPADIIVNGENGWLVPVGNATVMAERMKWIIENPDIAKKMGIKARNIQESNSKEIIIERYMKYIESLIKSKA